MDTPRLFPSVDPPPSFMPSSSPSIIIIITDALIYRGDVLAGGGYSKATATITEGEILKPTTGITGEDRAERGGGDLCRSSFVRPRPTHAWTMLQATSRSARSGRLRPT